MVKVNRAQRRRMKSNKRGGSQKAHRHMAGKLRAEQEEKIHNNKVYKKGQLFKQAVKTYVITCLILNNY